MAHITNKDLKAWGQFYLRILAVNCWNGFTIWFKVTASALAVSTLGKVDIRSIGFHGALWTLLGTIVYKIAETWFKFPLPEPTPPESTDGKSDQPPVI